MNRSPLMDRFGLRSKTNRKPRIRHIHLAVEPLEERRLLTAYNLLVSTLNPTGQINGAGGSSVLQYSEATNLRLPGGVFTGDHNLTAATGLAVAPDGSYYVSSLGATVDNVPTPGQVLHYSSSGAFLNVLGGNDTNPVTIYYPGTLAFGPNGNLYVADLGAGAIYQFDTTSAGQQYLPGNTLYLPSGFVPAGFTFDNNASHDLIVGNLNQQSVVEFHSDGTFTTLVQPGSGINPLAILALSNGNLLIADSDLGQEPTGHHQIVLYNAGTGKTSQFINLTTPVGTSQYGDAGNMPQPTSLLLDTDGNLLIGLAPSQSGDGAVLKYNIQGQTPILMDTIATGLGAPSGLGLVPVTPSDILFSTYVDTNGSSVLRYNDATQLPVPGGVTTGTGGLGTAAGVAVAPDGSYYVSSDATGQVLHFSSSGEFLNVLGANDVNKATLYAPGALAFGPDGNLYVADLGAGVIYQFDTASTTQQYIAADTLQLPPVATANGTSQFTPAGFTFAADATHDLIVGDLESGEVAQINLAQYDANGTFTTLIAPGTPSPNSVSGYPIVPIALLELSNGDLLIGDSTLGPDPADHHQILEYNPATKTITQVANLSTPKDAAGNSAQPVSMALDADGNLLVGVAPDQTTDGGAIQKFNLQVNAATGDVTATLSGTIASGVGAPSGLALVPSQVSDLLVGNLEDGVLRYSSANQALSSGDSAPGTGVPATTGVAVAPDGSYYVSSPGTGTGGSGQVLHYSSSGAFLNALDAGDTSGPTLVEPGTLAFGPDGNLYVADLGADSVYGAGAIYQYNVALNTQHQYVAADTLLLPPIVTPGGTIPFVPVGFTFAANATRDLIVGDYDTGEVAQFNPAQYEAGGTYTTLIAEGVQDPNNSHAGNSIFPIAMQELSNGDLLIADSNSGSDAADHHQVLEYNAAMSLVTTINLTAPTDTTSDPPNPPQPTSLQLTPDGNLLVGVSPNEYLPDGAVEEVNLTTLQVAAPIISSIGAPAGLAFVPPNVMSVPAQDWTSAGLTITAAGDGKLHVYKTGTTTDVIPPQAAASVGDIQISGPDLAANSLTIDFSGGSPIPPDGVFFYGATGAVTNTVTIADSAGSNAYSLNGTQLSLNGIPAVTMTNTQALSLDLGQGSLDLGGAPQGISSVTLVSGSLKNGTLSIGSISAQSGPISANLAGPGGLTKTGAGIVTLFGSNTYEGSTAVTAGTLVVASSGALPSGSSLTIGANAASMFGPAVAAQASPVLASSSVVAAAPSAADVMPVIASAAVPIVPAPLPAAPAPPSPAAINSIWAGYSHLAAPAARATLAAAELVWWNSWTASAISEGPSSGNDPRIAALDALLTLYGT